MIAPLAKFIDWLAIQTGELVSPADDRRNPRPAEAIQFLNNSDFLAVRRPRLQPHPTLADAAPVRQRD
jgi:hypothetical protein